MNEAEKLLEFNERYARNPLANQLRGQFVVIAGAGAVGSFVTAQLAHHGCDVTTVDSDRLEVPNLSRWYVSDPRYVGHPKAAILARQLRREVPALQKISSLVADIRQLTREQMAELFKDARLIIAATGRDDIDRVLDQWAQHFGIPILFPSMWAGDQAILGDLQVVAWNMSNRRRGACFSCVRPAREVEPPPAEAQPGTAAEVMRVAGLTTETALALLLRDSPQQAQLTAQLERGVNYFLVPRWPPSVRTVLTRRRRDCRACSAIRTRAGRSQAAAAQDTRARDWIVGLSLASAALWHQIVPGLDAIVTLVFIASLGLWWRGRLPNFTEVSSRIRGFLGLDR